VELAAVHPSQQEQETRSCVWLGLVDATRSEWDRRWLIFCLIYWFFGILFTFLLIKYILVPYLDHSYESTNLQAA
jgi:hypothetical protein